MGAEQSIGASAPGASEREALARATHVHAIPEDADVDCLIADCELDPPASVRPVDGVPGAFVIDSVLSKDECASWIALSERCGYTVAPITTSAGPVLDPEARNNLRVMLDISTTVRERLARRVGHLFPSEPAAPGRWALARGGAMFNERLRFYRYSTDQTFKPHFDGDFRRSPVERSMLTFIVYLNDGFAGGATTFFPDGRVNFYSPPGTTSPRAVNPRCGSALVFSHAGNSPFHEGSPHSSEGMSKYVLRSDIMYTRVLSESESEDGAHGR